MGLKRYLAVAVVLFLVATTGADVSARTAVGGASLSAALSEHLYWAGVQFVRTILLLAPFLAVALLCAGWEKKVRRRSVLAIFAIASLTLLYFYFQGHYGAQKALLEEHWTAAALSVGLLPFFIGVPVVVAVIGVGAIAAKLDRRTSDAFEDDGRGA